MKPFVRLVVVVVEVVWPYNSMTLIPVSSSKAMGGEGCLQKQEEKTCILEPWQQHSVLEGTDSTVQASPWVSSSEGEGGLTHYSFFSVQSGQEAVGADEAMTRHDCLKGRSG